MDAIPKPFDSMDHDVTTLAALIGHLPPLSAYFGDLVEHVNPANDDLESATSVRDILGILLEREPTGAVTAITLERFQMHCPSNSTLDRSTGLECASIVGSIHGSHDLWTRSAHEAWDMYERLYGSTPGAAWLTVLLQRRRSHLHKSSRCNYCWTVNVDYLNERAPTSTRESGSTGHQLARFFAHTREAVERALSRLNVHTPDHALARMFDTVGSSAGVIVRNGTGVVAANRAAERVLGLWMAEPLTEANIVRWLDDPLQGDHVRAEAPLPNGDEVFVVSRKVNSITLSDWSGPLRTMPFPSDPRARTAMCKQAKAGIGLVVECKREVGFRCLVLPFQNHVGVGISSSGCFEITCEDLQKLRRHELIELFERSPVRPAVILKRTDPIALIIAEK
jgi:hypothetical protein